MFKQMGSDRRRERFKGFLTDDDRAFLLNRKKEDRNRRLGIRNRLIEAILDFSYLMGHTVDRSPDGIPASREVGNGLSSDDLNLVFERQEEEQAEFDQALVDMVSVAYLGSIGRIPDFETVLKRGVRQAEQSLAESDRLGVDVEFDVTRTTAIDHDWDRITQHARHGDWDQLTEEELRSYMEIYQRAGDFEPERPKAHLQEQYDEYIAEQKAKGKRADNARRIQQGKENMRDDGRRK